MENLNITELKKRLQLFAKERDWEQFHAPKNLAVSLAIESAELLEKFQWSDEYDRDELGEELADVLLYAIRLADRCGINLEQALENKIKINVHKYPIDLAHGKSKKYNQ